MIDSSMYLEKFLQEYRFKMVIPYLNWDVLDFWWNQWELKKFVKWSYTVVNYDHSDMENKKFDTIVSLAVIEHIEFQQVFELFKKFKNCLNDWWQIFITTPTIYAKPVLESLAFLRLVDKANIDEHKHYWNKKEIYELAQESWFEIVKYKIFQVCFNQLAVFKHKK